MNVLMSSGHLSKTLRKAFAYLLPAALSFIFSVSCSRDEKVIPRDKMAQIYADMLLMDQWIIAHPEARRTADTTLVYEPVFERYGYDSDDYLASVDFYLQDPDRYARILKNTSLILEERLAVLRAEKARLNEQSSLEEMQLLYATEYDFMDKYDYQYETGDSIVFSSDSTGRIMTLSPYVRPDTLFAGPAICLSYFIPSEE